MAYATVDDVQARMSQTMTTEQRSICTNLLNDASVVIDAYNDSATTDSKKVVSCRMVVRAMGSLDAASMPIGANQGSMSALGYSQSWTISAGSVGELYLSKLDKKLLGVGDKMGASNPLAFLVRSNEDD